MSDTPVPAPKNFALAATAANDNAARLAIGGGGISGLSTAIYALKHGVPAEKLHIFETTKRTGGKIETDYLQGRPVNKAAEFIDSDQEKIIAMAKELGVPLVAANDQDTDYFHLPNGQVMGGKEFRASYKPIAERVITAKEELKRDPKGPLAQRLNHISMDDYINELAASTPASINRSIVQTITDTVTFKKNQVDPNITAMVKGMFRSEEGNLPTSINAFQFVSEHSATVDDIFSSDCAFRVEGGTENLIKAMHKNLADAGVHFHMNAPVQAVNKTADGKLSLAIGGANPQQFITDKFIAAVPTYALKDIQGLKELGLADDAHQLITATQYTNSIKFTVAMKDGAIADKSNFFDSKGYQCWSSDPHQVTFLANADDVTSGKMNVKNFMQNCMDDYTKAMGKPVGSLFAPLSADTVSLTNPGKNQNCYCSPGKDQMLQLEKMGNTMDALAANGVCIVGTFMPARTPDGLGVGFMECGLNSAEHACDMLLTKEQSRGYWVARHQAQQAAQAANSNLPGKDAAVR